MTNVFENVLGVKNGFKRARYGFYKKLGAICFFAFKMGTYRKRKFKLIQKGMYASVC